MEGDLVLIYAYVGTYNDSFIGSLRGNGKDNSMVYFLHEDFLEGREVITNFFTTFSKMERFKIIVDMIINGDLENVSIGLTEIQAFLNSLGTSSKIINFADKAVSQTRKREVDLHYTTQRFFNVHKRLRTQTDRVLEPRKYHYDDTICLKDRCKLPHLIKVYSVSPWLKNPLQTLKAEKVGELYNTNEVISDEINKEELIQKTPKKKGVVSSES